MNLLTILALIVLVSLLSSNKAMASDEYIPNEVLISFHKKGTAASIGALIKNLSFREYKLKKTLVFKERNFYLLKHDRAEDIDKVIEELKRDPRVASAQPNYIYKTLSVPNDTFYSSMWGLKNSGQNISSIENFGPDFPSAAGNPGTANADMSMEKVWDRISDCSSTVVAVVDSGVRYDHEDLASNIWDGSGQGFPNHGYDTFSSDSDPMDENGHGTHVAGTIGAVGNNAKGSVGVCWKVQIMAVRVLNAAGFGTTVTISGGINWAVAHGAKVLNLSVGTSNNDPVLEQVIDDTLNQDVVVISAAGNDGTNNDQHPLYPCNYSKTNTLCVAALSQTYMLADFSNFGVAKVDVAAPGVNIVSPWILSKTDVADDFSAGWQLSTTSATAWGHQVLGAASTHALTAPANWNNSVQYANNTDARAYKSFDMSAFESVRLSYGIIFNTGAGDLVRTYCEGGAADPTGGTVLDANSGTTGSSGYSLAYDVSDNCANSFCTPGFQFVTNASGTNTGIAIFQFKLTGYSAGTVGYNVIRGTSMATPHVAGLAALLRAYNPSYTAADVTSSIKNGGRSILALSVKTKSGKAVDALGSLSHVLAPTGVTAQALP